MFWMAAGIPPPPTAPALDGGPAQPAEAGTGDRGDGVPVLHKTANIFSCVDAVGSVKGFNDIINLMRSSVSEYTA